MLEFKELDAIKTKDGREGTIIDDCTWKGVRYLMIEPENAKDQNDCFDITADDVAEVIYRCP